MSKKKLCPCGAKTQHSPQFCAWQDMMDSELHIWQCAPICECFWCCVMLMDNMIEADAIFREAGWCGHE